MQASRCAPSLATPRYDGNGGGMACFYRTHAPGGVERRQGSHGLGAQGGGDRTGWVAVGGDRTDCLNLEVNDG